MEFRKLIAFGKNSFIISLPKSWLKGNNLSKGDLVYVDEKSDKLVVYPKKKEQKRELKQITIDTSNKNFGAVQREIISSYINNYNMVYFVGKDLKTKVDDIRTILDSLVAMEVIEQTSDRLVAKDFLDMSSINIKNIVRKLDVTLRSMITDCKGCIDMDNTESIINRDRDVNRLCFLIFRAIKSTPETNTKVIVTELIGEWMLAYNLEQTADEVKRISRLLASNKFSKEEKAALIELCSLVEKAYLGAIKAYYNDDKNLAYQIAAMKNTILKKCGEFFRNYGSKPMRGNIIEKLRSMVSHIHNITRTAYE